MRINVDGADFDFPTGWSALKWDDSAFFNDVFSRIHDGIKAVDVLAVEADPSGGDTRLVLIEVKDYRHSTAGGKHPSKLAEEVAKKVTATLAGLTSAASRADDPAEKALALRARVAPQLHVVLHCEDRQVPIVDPSELLIKLRGRLAPITDSVFVANERRPRGAWSVEMPEVD